MQEILGLPEDRMIVPRWRNYETTVSLGELSGSHISTNAINKATIEDLERLIKDWQEHGTLFYASDLVSSAFVSGIPEAAQDAAELIINSPEASTVAKDIAQKLLKGPIENQNIPSLQWNNDYFRKHIHYLRERLRLYPRNAILRIEMARAYTVLRLIKQAESQINIAISLAPQNRFVLRAASRFFLHIGRKDLAHQVLYRSGILNSDPWLLAAELAVADLRKQPSYMTKNGIKMIEDNNIHPFHKSELACTLGMREYEHGALKKARKLFVRTLYKPTENAVAQIAHINKIENKSLFELEEDVFTLPHSFEALTYRSLATGDFEMAERNAVDWHHDQPFSSRATRCLAHILLVNYDLDRSEELCRLFEHSLKHDKVDESSYDNIAFSLNNLAYIFARNGKVGDAQKKIKEIDIPRLSLDVKLTVQATKALILYREGLSLFGKELYEATIDSAKLLGNDKYRFIAIASINYAREELRAKSETKDEIYERAVQLSSKMNHPDVVIMLKRLQDQYSQTVAGIKVRM